MANQINTKEAQIKNYVLPVVPDAARARVEIDEFLADNDMTNLYLLAMEAMQQEHKENSAANGNEDWWTFYSLAAIHGLPSEQWNGVANKNSSTQAAGYCTHGELVFPTWHRVYMAMFEQTVLNKMQDIASQYTIQQEKSVYQNAVNKFRLPFWDPFLPRHKLNTSTDPIENIWGIPEILAAKNVWVKRPNPRGAAEVKSIPNPLYQFSFPSQDTLQDKNRPPVNFNGTGVSTQGRDHTIRTPGPDGETNIYGDGPRQREGLDLKIRRQAISSSTKLWKLLSRYNKENDNEARSWASFASHYVIDPQSQSPMIDRTGKPIYQSDTSISLESWHDDIHGLVGTGNGYRGHMGNPAVAGFDPIFWLHHCNIDRIFAIYQALYPDKWVPASGRLNSSTKLYPFRKDANEFWNSNDVKDWRTLGYAIPGNQRLTKESTAILETHLHEYYNWATEGAAPPPSVAKYWPKDLSPSFALFGSKARKIEQPVLRFEALQQSRLVTRSVALQATEKPDIQVVDEPKTISVKDLTSTYPPVTIQDGKLLTWNARISVRKFAFNGSFNIHLFIGPINDDQPERFITKKNEVGFSSIFASSIDAPCANCIQQREDGMLYEDAIPITTALLAYLQSNTGSSGPNPTLRTLESFRPEHVVPFLKANIGWRLTDLASNLITDEQDLLASKLEVTVTARSFELPSAEKPLGEYYPAYAYEEITNDKLGGFGFDSGTAREL